MGQNYTKKINPAIPEKYRIQLPDPASYHDEVYEIPDQNHETLLDGLWLDSKRVVSRVMVFKKIEKIDSKGDSYFDWVQTHSYFGTE